MLGTAQLPGYLPSPLYAYLNSDVNFNPQSLGGINETIEIGLFCRARTNCVDQEAARKVAHDDPYLPMWIGPETKNDASLTGPEITIASGQTVVLRFPGPYDADFIMAWILDDSTSTSGLEPVMDVVIQEEDTRERFVDDPNGISFRDFVACSTNVIVGMPGGGVVRAMSLKGHKGGWTHRIPKTSAIQVTIISGDVGTITFRAALLGWAVQVRGS
jgi:hypothetical protein